MEQVGNWIGKGAPDYRPEQGCHFFFREKETELYV